MYLYLIGAYDYNGEVLAVKIGVAGDVKKRIAAMQTGQFCEMRLICAWRTDSRMKCFAVEKLAHEHYERRRMRGEWFRRMVMLDAVQVISEFMGSLPCEVPSVAGSLSDFREAMGRKRERNRCRRAARKANRSIPAVG